MPLIEELMRYQNPAPPAGADIGLPKGQAYASYYPQWETQSPQYISPNAYNVTQVGFRTNEFVYSIIQKRAEAVAQAPLRFWDDTGETPEELEDSPMREFLDNINQFLPESAFWGISEISRCIGGFAAWEIETTNGGDPYRLWFMRPDWCSFIRSQQKPLAFIRYQPYGLPPMDIDIEKILFMFSPTENFDPLYPFIKFLSPAMLALPQINVDNGMTRFLSDFIQRGARFGGLISVMQTLSDDGANDIRRRWQQQHGGVENWTTPLVLGQGADYKPMQMNFDDMAFPELDARTETRICNAFNIDPIVANARAGLDVSSYNNKSQATKDWYYSFVVGTWKMYAASFGQQMLPKWNYDPREYYAAFHTEDVYALTEDKEKMRRFWLDAAKANKITTNEFREHIDLDPLDDPEADKIPTPQQFGLPPAGGNRPPFGKQPNNGMATDQQPNTQPTEAQQEAKDNEATKFRSFAKRRVKEGKSNIIASYEFKYHNLDEQTKLLAEFGIVPELNDPLLVLADAINNAYNNHA